MNSGNDAGAGTATSLGIFSAAIWLLGLSISSTTLALEQVRLQVVADTIAVAASDVWFGLASGVPCESAEDLAVASLVALTECSIVGESVHISLSVKSLGIVLSAEAFAEQLR